VTIVPLAEASAEETFGGKAASLARAIHAGLPVPDGYAISWQNVAKIASGDDASAPPFDGCVAVRSSAIGEDSADASFAGQHATILNVTSHDALLAAVRTIHASASAEGAREYRKRMGLNGEPRIAVVVQQMIAADVAGVLFTRDPVTGKNECVIESAFGLGEGVVSGIVTPDRFRLTATGEIVERIAARKEVAVRYAPDGGTIEVPLHGEEAERLTLDDAQLAALHEIAKQCETFFGGPQDIEWAIAKGQLFLLQSRPITTRGTPRTSEEPEEPLSMRRFTGLALAALLAPLNSTIIAVALPSIATTFDSSAALVTRWLVTGYLVVTIVAQSPAGKLADLWGSSRVLTIGRALFGAGALLAALSPTLAVLGCGRVLMALGGALSIPTVFAQLRRSVPFHKRGRIFGIFGAVMGGAAAAGPILGGFLTARYGWHSVFFLNVPVVLLSFVLEPPTREEVVPSRKSMFDFTGSALLGIAVLLLVAAVERVDALLAAATIVVLIAFVLRERSASDPVLDVALFRSAPFAAGGAIVALQNLAMYSMVFLIPFFLAKSGAAPSRTGTVLLCFTAAMVLTAPIGGWISDATGARIIAALGALIATTGATLFVTSGDTMLIVSLVVMGVGIGLSTSPSQAAAISAISASQAGVAAGALSTLRYVGGIIASGLVALLVAGDLAHDARLFVFPAVLFASAAVALWLPGPKRA